MKLTKNERKTLKLLLDNARVADSDIAKKLRISSQAVGKIRRKLEATVINQYTLDLDFSKLGIRLFALAITKVTQKGFEKGQQAVEPALLDNPHVIQVCRTLKGSATYLLLLGFANLEELDTFFRSSKQEISQILEVQEIFTFSHQSMLKNNPIPLYNVMIDRFHRLPAFLNTYE